MRSANAKEISASVLRTAASSAVPLAQTGKRYGTSSTRRPSAQAVAIWSSSASRRGKPGLAGSSMAKPPSGWRLGQSAHMRTHGVFVSAKWRRLSHAR